MIFITGRPQDESSPYGQTQMFYNITFKSHIHTFIPMYIELDYPLLVIVFFCLVIFIPFVTILWLS